MGPNIIRLFLLGVILLVSHVSLMAQPDTTSSVDSVMRSHDKIYVVMAVGVVILIGLLLYVIRVDRKVSKLEKNS